MGIKVAIVGAAGETGRSIVQCLLDASPTFEVIALVRPSSVDKPLYHALVEQGVKLAPFDPFGPAQDLIKILNGVETLIVCIKPTGFSIQKPLANAAKLAGVKRFVPSFFATVSPPTGVVDIREEKEDILNHIKKTGLGYTVIDVGWWYQGLVPKVQSGRTNYAIPFTPLGANVVPGDGTTQSGITDIRDIGKWVARIIADDRTLNKMVFAYSDVVTMNEAFDLMEKLSEEMIERRYHSQADFQNAIDETRIGVAEGLLPPEALLKLYFAQYYLSWGIRADNTPTYAHYLGYLDGKQLYPELECITLEAYYRELLEGNASVPYSS